jgi:NAD(P)-dependent dehydrogenase (short-subunit alcohol dehydrogenase family)
MSGCVALRCELLRAVPLLIANSKGLIVNTGHYGAVCYFHGPAYGAQKAGADKMVADMATELRPHNVAAVSIWMGGLDTERARAYLNSLRPEARPTTKRESPEFTGRLIAALYASKGENGAVRTSIDWG